MKSPPLPSLGSADVDVDRLVDVFLPTLRQEWTHRKLPYGLEQALARAQFDSDDSTDFVFLREGFQPWLAYFLTQPRKRHCRGQSARAKAIAKLHQLPVEVRRQVARKVGQTRPCDSVRRGIRSLEARYADRLIQKKPKARQPKLPPSARVAASPSRQAAPLEIGETKTSEAGSADQSTSRMPVSKGSDQPASSQPASDQTDTQPSSTTPAGHLLMYASPRAIAEVLPSSLASAIQHIKEGNGWVANVQMVYPEDPKKVNCVLQFAIVADKIEQLAWDLFGVRVQVNGPTRSVVLSGGVTVVPRPEFALRGCTDEAVDNVFGPAAAGAIKASTYYVEEKRQDVVCTQCVGMHIPRDSKETAALIVDLGLVEGIKLGAMLKFRDT